MDSFFASVEVREKSEIARLPVVAGADPKKGKVRELCICLYEAREYDIHSAMPISQSYKLCPRASFLPVNMGLYVQASNNVMEIMKDFADKFQHYSIDEAFLVPRPEIQSYEKAAVITMR
jgi:DNA polymerase IV (archaeal DinB-like DNA polymerase)